MIFINIQEAKTRLPELLSKIERTNEPIVICRRGKPVAKMIAWKNRKNPFKLNPRLMNVVIREDPTKPLSDDNFPA
jgi:prevent-host-death family protein